MRSDWQHQSGLREFPVNAWRQGMAQEWSWSKNPNPFHPNSNQGSSLLECSCSFQALTASSRFTPKAVALRKQHRQDSGGFVTLGNIRNVDYVRIYDGAWSVGLARKLDI